MFVFWVTTKISNIVRLDLISGVCVCVTLMELEWIGLRVISCFLQKGEYEIPEWLSRGTVHLLAELLKVYLQCALS